jgi:hypothetical protein
MPLHVILDDQLRTPEIDTIDPFGYGVSTNFVLVNGPAAERVLSVPPLIATRCRFD